MAKLRAPLLSMRARGQLGQSLVLSDWKGISYARQYVVPENPRTAAQTETRSVFRWLQNFYRHAGAVAKAPWTLGTVGRPLTPANYLIAMNLPPLRNETNLADFVFSAGARGGPAPANFSATPGPGPRKLTIQIEPPDLPTGWTVISASFAALRDQDPHQEFVNDFAEASDSTPSPYEAILTMDIPNTPYMAGAWIVYERPDGTPAMSVSAQTILLSGS